VDKSRRKVRGRVAHLGWLAPGCLRTASSHLAWLKSDGMLTEDVVKGIVIGFIVAGLMAGPALAQDRLDCGKAYKELWGKIEREKYAKIPPDQLAAINRLALHAYDSCQAGDEQEAKQVFAKVAALIFDADRGGPGPYNPNQPTR